MAVNAKPWRYQRAFNEGFRQGQAGNSTASPPYIVTDLTARLVREWLEGHQAGLEDFRSKEKLRREVSAMQEQS